MNFQKLLQTSTSEKLSSKSFILLSALCSPQEKELYDVLQNITNDHQIQLIVDWSLATKTNSENFWIKLAKIDESNKFLQKFLGVSAPDFSYKHFINYAKTHIENHVVLQLLGTFNPTDENLIELFEVASQPNVLYQKIKHLLSSSQTKRLMDLNLITSQEEEEEEQISLKLNKLDTYLEIRRKLWIYETTKSFIRLQITPERFLNHFKTLCTGDVSQQLLESFSIETKGYHQFNVQNFMSEKLPQILNLLGEDLPTKKESPDLKKLNELINDSGSDFSLEDNQLFEYFKNLTQKSGQLDYSLTIINNIEEFINSKQYEKLNKLLLALINNKDLINIILFNTGCTLLYKLIDYIDFENFKIDSDDDFQELYSYASIGLLSIIYIIEIFEIDLTNLDLNTFTINFLSNFYYRLVDNLTNNLPEQIDDDDDKTIVSNYDNLMIEWINALFNDSNDDGLSDELIKSLNVKQIYKFMPIIYKQAILATNLGSIDFGMLNNGLDYLSQTFLLPVTVCLVKWMKRNDNELLGKVLEIFKSIDPNISGVVNEIINHKIQQPVDKNSNIWDTIKYGSNFDKFDLLKYNKLEIIQYIIQETFSLSEESKLFVNILVSLVISDSITTKHDKEYWRNQLTTTTPSDEVPQIEKVFTSSIDYHFSSIFNDEQQKDVDEFDEFFTNNEEDIEMKIPTSESLQQLQSLTKKKNCFLYYFVKIKNSTTSSNLFHNTIKSINEKFLEEIDNWEI
ncbi:NUT1 [Candida jiufengensis]|uniref:NUT1 n=1 Tax=Candida jiufengensis TaxID=497108 RepID=UPI002225A0F9|nr:NUT1 [Candida jiufengensis]KAI5954431.1 NUT1 [Candida jiufengensis]